MRLIILLHWAPTRDGGLFHEPRPAHEFCRGPYRCCWEGCTLKLTNRPTYALTENGDGVEEAVDDLGSITQLMVAGKRDAAMDMLKYARKVQRAT